ncbi:YczI family protein [Virgibacillus doumboii]|uniref:YczI family protein n=1 Tax=Virgibacillus doumboii TaxID=2697503 RepID=UPI0024843C15|nr:YczI family protein [Virgibacillus doumboii]
MIIIRVILSVIVILLSGYMLFTGEYGIMPYMQLLFGVMFLVWGISEFQENRKATAILLLLTAGFVLFVGIYILLN